MNSHQGGAGQSSAISGGRAPQAEGAAGGGMRPLGEEQQEASAAALGAKEGMAKV